jgi:thiol-disulfide isomerase/thioredoxin
LEILVNVLLKKFHVYGKVLLIIGVLLTITACGTAQAVGSEVVSTQEQVLTAENLMSIPSKETGDEEQGEIAPVKTVAEIEVSTSEQDISVTQEIPETNPTSVSEVASESLITPGPESEPLPAEALPPVGPEVGLKAPDFSMKTLKGETISLADLRGKNVLINCWVTWCVPCMEELEVLENIHQAYQGTDFVVLSVNGIKQDSLPEVEATVAGFNLTYPVLLAIEQLLSE